MMFQDEGYSNWTVTETSVHCLKGNNPNLPADLPWDWDHDPDNWPLTNTSRCDFYGEGVQIHMDVEGSYLEDELQSVSPEVVEAYNTYYSR